MKRMKFGNAPSTTLRVVIHSREFQSVKVFLTAVWGENGELGGLFVTCDVVGTTLRGMLDLWSAACRNLLDKGASAKDLVEAFAWHEFEPKGMTDHPELRFARSVPDLAVRWAEREEGKGARHGE